MTIWEKSVPCAKCGELITIKSFRKNPGEYKFGTGYICPDCVQEAAENAEAEAEATTAPEDNA